MATEVWRLALVFLAAMARQGHAVTGECPVVPPLPTLATPGRCEACVPPPLNLSESCMYDMSSCAVVAPGSTCEVKCAAPFTGLSGTGRCLGSTTEKGTKILWSPPMCECPEPPPQQGYKKSSLTGRWQCADDYRGRPYVLCNSTQAVEGQACAVASWLMSCLPLVPCAQPLVDTCRFDTTGCESVPPGGTCQVRCRSPLTGGASVATCPNDNTVVGRPLDYRPLRCMLQVCPDPNPWPIGYNKTEMGNWTCASGYSGVAINRCMPGANWTTDCVAEARLDGCLETVACGAPEVTGVEACMYDLSNCQNVLPGDGCEVRCKNPYVGTVTQASCAANNTDEERLQWVKPVCRLLDCTDPGQIPAGYLMSINGWQCAQSYSGFAVKVCNGNEQCEVQPKLQGCAQLVPCVAPMVDCRYDMYDCVNVLPGSKCEVRCKAPFVGMPTTASCLTGNTNISGLQWTAPECTVGDCADPLPWPAGYKKGLAGWQCASGYAGVVNKSCVWQPSSCSFAAELSGCLPEAGCAPLQVSSRSSCTYNVSQCSRLNSGRSCQVTCRAPFVGPPATAACPAGNTDENTEPTWTEPACSCSDPSPFPQEYNRTVLPEQGLVCSNGYAGTPQKLCQVGSGCVVTPILTGCSMPVVCEVAPFADAGSRNGRVTGSLSFGRAMVLGSVNEDAVVDYKAYFADNCLRPIGPPLGVVKRQPSEESCCRSDSYVLSVNGVLLPATATGFLLVVGTATGDAPNGKYITLDGEKVVRQVTAAARRGTSAALLPAVVAAAAMLATVPALR